MSAFSYARRAGDYDVGFETVHIAYDGVQGNRLETLIANVIYVGAIGKLLTGNNGTSFGIPNHTSASSTSLRY